MSAARSLDDAFVPTPDQRASFDRDGHVTIRGLLDASELAAIEPGLTAAVEERTRAAALPWDERTTYERAFLQVMNLWRTCDAAQRIVFSERLASTAARLLGVSGVRLYHDQALYKEPAGAEGGHTPWHVDQYYWPLTSDRSVTAWIPLSPVPNEAGPLGFASGSQTYGGLRHLEISDESEDRCAEELVRAGFELSREPFDVGDVSFHMGWTYHSAPANRSSSTRRVMTVIYVDADMRVAEPENDHQRNDLATWFPGLAPGDLAASEINPLLWSE